MTIKISTLKTKSIGTVLSNSMDTYKDISDVFNFTPDKTKNQLLGANLSYDMSADTDYKAISNSIQNIFNTSPGEKILNPAFGADLKRYLFEPIDETTAEVIGNVIVKALKLYEPRVVLENVQVVAQPDENQYTINVYMKIPAIKTTNKEFKFTGTLTDRGVSTAGNTPY